mmetsp:Transcript_127934/g.409874  ORF Transcript_127934/g.409874 Transcript_127934/m.409874 type:complete len:589 (+) Transcript_127934:117-1883(+)
MGPLKDEMYYQVWCHLLTSPRMSTLVTCLVSPKNGTPAVRNAWAQLQSDAGRFEGMTKKKGLQAVLAERPDLFNFRTNERSHLLIELTDAAKGMAPTKGIYLQADGSPAPMASMGSLGLGGENAAYAAADAQLAYQLEAQAALAAQQMAQQVQASWSAIPDPGSASGLPQAKRQKTDASGSLPDSAVEDQLAKVQREILELERSMNPGLPTITPPNGATLGMGSSDAAAWAAMAGSAMPDATAWNSMVANAQAPLGKDGRFQDLVWTPSIQAARERDRTKDRNMATAMYHAMEIQYNGNAVTLSQLGSDFRVAQLKKDVLYKNLKLIDIVKRFEEYFELVPDPSGAGGFVVRMQPGAAATLPPPDRSAAQASGPEANMGVHPSLLPPSIENPTSMRDRMQALRIEIVLALARRGNRAPGQELGQEPRIQKLRTGLSQAKKLLDFIKIFPSNFALTADGLTLQATTYIELVSYDVHDQEMIDLYLLRIHQAQLGLPRGMDGRQGGGKKGGKGRGKGGGCMQGIPGFASLGWASDPSMAASIAAAQAQAQAQLQMSLAHTMAIAGLPGLSSSWNVAMGTGSQVGFSPPNH